MYGTWGTAIDVAVSTTVSDEEGMASVAKVHFQLHVAFLKPYD
jgi:hypothetical protein